MKNIDTFEFKGNQTVRERHSVHVSTVYEHIFQFRIYLLLEIFTVFLRDPRTGTDRSRTERFGSVLGQDRTRTEKN